MSFMDELRKIPPVTRFLCGSTLAVSLPVMMQIVSPYKVLFVRGLVTQRFELWRVYTSFFLGSSGISFLFDFIMLYRNSNELETRAQASSRGSANYAWQVLLAAGAILALNLPLQSFTHTRPLLICLTYLSSRLSPPGTQTSIFGLVSIPLIYFPFALIFLDLVMGGPAAAAQAVTGAVVGHLWWWAVWDTRYGVAPGWLRRLLGDGGSPGGRGGSVGGGSGGVQVIPPRRVREEQAATSGHSWGSGQRLGTD